MTHMERLIREARLWVDVWLSGVEQLANGEMDSVNGLTGKLFDDCSVVALLAAVHDGRGIW